MYQDQAKQKALEFRIEATKFKIENLDPSSSIFLDVKDKVLKYIQPAHSWHPEVTSVQEVFNANLLEAFYSCQAGLFDPSSAREKFHGTDAEACEKIVHNGFRLPRNDGIQQCLVVAYILPLILVKVRKRFTQRGRICSFCATFYWEIN